MSEHIKIEQSGTVLRMTMARMAKKNALTSDMYDTMRGTIEKAQGDGTRAIVICGGEGVFSAGNDIADFLKGGEMADIGEMPALRFIRVLAVNQVPLVAAVDGLAIGIGTTLTLHCDLVYATARTIFKMPFVDLSLVPEAASSLIVPQRVGMAKATELLMLGEGYDASEALRLGLINAIIPQEALIGHAMAQAQRLASKPAGAIAATRRLMRGDPELLSARIEGEMRAFALGMQSNEARQIFAAFLAKGTG